MNETTQKAQAGGARAAGSEAEPDVASAANSRGGPEEQAPSGEEGGSLSMDQVKQERDDLKDQVLRARAEFANYQKRAKQQADSDRLYAVGTLAKDLLDPLDNLERAIEALRGSGAAGVTAGLDMVQRQLAEVLAKHGVEPINAQGCPFDPHLHDAVLQQPSNEHPEGVVVTELSKGYRIRERVLRPSKVAVSTKPAGG